MVSLMKLHEYKTVLVTFAVGKLQYNAEFQKLLKKVSDSMGEILDIGNEE